MKKQFVWLLLVLILLAASATAMAGGIVDPGRPEAEQYLKIKQEIKSRKDDSGRKEGTPQVTLTKDPVKPEPGTTVHFTVKVDGIIDDDVIVKWGVADESRDSSGWLFFCGGLGSTLDYTFYSSGIYSCYVWVYSDNTEIGNTVVFLTIEKDGIHPTLEDKAQEIVNACRGDTDWETVLNLHDWLTHHMYYEYNYYGADALFRGYGTCDCYAKSFLLLCSTAGITAERITSTTHGWNTVCLDGEWYQVDCTWDDPGLGGPADSGREVYEFFCLSSEIIQQIDEHKVLVKAGHALDCTTLVLNYYIYTGQWVHWGDTTEDETGQETVVPWTAAVTQTFDDGYDVYEFVPGWPYYLTDQGTVLWSGVREPEIIIGIWNYGLSGYEWELVPGGAIYVEKELDNRALRFRLRGWILEETGRVTIPTGVAEIQEEAFVGITATTAVLTENCSMIGPRAFADSNVRTVYIPSDSVEIDASAFDGCGRVIVVTDTNSETAAFARENGWIVCQGDGETGSR